jgi:arylsulfatase A-like enzyme
LAAYSLCVLATFVSASCEKGEAPYTPESAQYVARAFANEWRQALLIPSGSRKTFDLGNATKHGVLYWAGGIANVGTSGARFRGYVGDELFAEVELTEAGAWVNERHPIPAGNGPGRPVRVEVDAGDADIYISDVGLVDLDRVAERPNVLIVMVDTLRRDHLQVFGYERDTSANVAELAGDGFVFEQATSSSSWTKTAIASLLTSYRPDRHRVMGHVDSLPYDVPTLPALLNADGYHTIGVSANGNISNYFGYARGFDRFSQFKKVEGDRRVMEAALESIRFAEGRPWLAYVHFMGPHSPYSPSDDLWHRFQNPKYAIDRGTINAILTETSNEGMGFAARLLLSGDMHHDDSCKDCPDIQERIGENALRDLIRDVYDAEIFNTDRIIGEMLGALREDALYENTLVIFVSDHGEELWDHGRFHHGHALYDELIRVPLIIKPPGKSHSPARLRSVAQLVDLVPTISDYTGTPMTWDGNGISLKPMMEGQQSPHRLAVAQLDRPVGFKPYLSSEKISLRVVRDATRKLFHDQTNNRWTYFDLAADPLEQNPFTDIPASAIDMREAIDRMPLLHRPGLNLLIAMPRDRAAEIAITVTGNDLPQPHFDTSLPDTAVEQINAGWRFRVSTDLTSGHATSSPYFNPIAWIPITRRDKLALSITMNGEPFPSGRVSIYGTKSALDADGNLTPGRIRRTQSTPYRGAAVKDAPGIFIWFHKDATNADAQEIAEELKDELETLGYL